VKRRIILFFIFIFYFSNNLSITRVWKEVELLKQLEKKRIMVSAKEDVVIKGLGFFKVMKDDILDIYVIPGVDVYTRKSLI